MESRLRGKIVKYLNQHGFAFAVENTAHPGTPDISYLLNRTQGWIEVKEEDEKLRPTQVIWIKNFLKSGGLDAWILCRESGRWYLIHVADYEHFNGKRSKHPLKDACVWESDSLEGLEKQL